MRPGSVPSPAGLLPGLYNAVALWIRQPSRSLELSRSAQVRTYAHIPTEKSKPALRPCEDCGTPCDRRPYQRLWRCKACRHEVYVRWGSFYRDRRERRLRRGVTA